MKRRFLDFEGIYMIIYILWIWGRFKINVIYIFYRFGVGLKLMLYIFFYGFGVVLKLIFNERTERRS